MSFCPLLAPLQDAPERATRAHVVAAGPRRAGAKTPNGGRRYRAVPPALPEMSSLSCSAWAMQQR
jgi:hypothetical protein